MGTITIAITTIIPHNPSSHRLPGLGPFDGSRRGVTPVYLLMLAVPVSGRLTRAHATIRPMKRFVAAILLCMFFATPSFASKHPRQHHKPVNMTYKAPKSYKVHVHKQRQKHHHPA